MANPLSELTIIDCDTHVIEPPDLWTSRVSVKRFGELVPHVKWDDETQQDAWFFGDRRVTGVAKTAMAGWPEFPPQHPAHLSDVDPGLWEANARLKKMDEYGIFAQILYPNVAGFGSGQFLSVQDPELMLMLVRAYNDFLAEFASADSNRYLPMMCLPFWDLSSSVVEMERCAALGHRGIVFGSQPEYWGSPDLTDRHWDPLWARAQEMGLPINFHIAAGDVSMAMAGNPQNGASANFASQSIGFFVDNARAITKVIFGGICHRFPNLNFVSVESGVGWIPFAVSAMDWQWKNCGVGKEHPEYELLPSEYFSRQIYGCFWFEKETLHSAVELIGFDNLLYETDFPHPTSMSPGPASAAVEPREYIDDAMKGFSMEQVKKLLSGNAARIYGLADSPPKEVAV
ncbi:MAG: amidohydrolase family protein [Acidimicrobiales bacterium]